MRYGSPIAAGFGNPENDIASLTAARRTGRASLQITFRPVDGKGNGWFGIYINDCLAANVYAVEGALAGPFEVSVPRGGSECYVTVIRLGQLSDPGYHIERVARTFEVNNSQVVTLTWKWQPDCIGVLGDSGITGQWHFDNPGQKIRYGATTPKPEPQGNWTALRLEIVIGATTITLNLYCQNTLVATGSALLSSLPAEVAVAEVNGSGVAGSCNVYPP